MGQRIASDHATVESHRVAVEGVGRTGRVRVALPDAVDVAADDVVRMALSGTPGYAHVTTTLEGDLAVDRVADNARLAREGEGEDRLQRWVQDETVAVQAGGSCQFDVVTAGHQYGLRAAGERVHYDATAAPDDDLADIAADLGED